MLKLNKHLNALASVTHLCSTLASQSQYMLSQKKHASITHWIISTLMVNLTLWLAQPLAYLVLFCSYSISLYTPLKIHRKKILNKLNLLKININRNIKNCLKKLKLHKVILMLMILNLKRKKDRLTKIENSF